MAAAFLTDDPAWQALKKYYDENGKKINMLELFKSDPDRFKKFSLR